MEAIPDSSGNITKGWTRQSCKPFGMARTESSALWEEPGKNGKQSSRQGLGNVGLFQRLKQRNDKIRPAF